MYVVTINGLRHEVVIGEDGCPVYNPPLSQEQVDKGNRNIKDICKSRTAPGISSDETQFHSGRGTLLDQLDGDEPMAKYLVQEARKQGYNPGANDVYIGQLADRPGQREAWFKPGEGKSELKRRARKLGKGIEAPGISIPAALYVDKGPAKLNPKIAKRMFDDYRKRGECGSMNDGELKKHIQKKHGRAKE